MTCPLCGSQATVITERILNAPLDKMYTRLTGRSCSYLINKDISKNLCERCDLIFFDPMITGDEDFYASLQEIDWYYMDEKEEYRYAQQFITSDNKVLDVGSGKGAFAKLLPTTDYVGLDFSIGAKKLARKNGLIIENETIQEHAHKHPEEYDVVCSFQVLEHVSNPYEFIQGKLMALKHNGLLIIGVPSEDSYLKYVCNGILNMPPHHVTRWSDKTLNSITTIFDLELIDLYHEKVQEVHKREFLSTFIQTLFLKPILVEDTLIRKIFSKISNIIITLIEKKIRPEFFPFGHTVVAVYRKKKP